MPSFTKVSLTHHRFHSLLVTALLCMVLPLSAHCKTITAIVPFENILLDPNDIIQSTYSFGDHPIIFCYENNQQTVGNVQWPFQGQLINAPLSLTLVTNSQYEGEFADPNGTITITNTINFPLVVNCLFAF